MLHHVKNTAKDVQMPLTAADIMTKKVIVAQPSESVAKVARLLCDRETSALPICDPQGTVLGIPSEGDLIRPIGREKAASRAWWPNLLAEGADLAPAFLESLSVENHLAGDLMVTPAITSPVDASVPELADRLAHNPIKRLPTLRDGKRLGLVSRAGVVRAIARTPGAVVEPI
jgi:CBS-domain-containing membrane protein